MGFNLNDYETVEDRLARFWEAHPNGRIVTTMMHYDDQKVVMRAEIWTDATDEQPKATGFAEEVRGSSPVNKTSHVENAETSAIGRCLANMSLKKGPRPSRQEMEKVGRAGGSPVMAASETPRPPADRITTIGGQQPATPKQTNFIRVLAKKAELDEEALFHFIQTTLEDDSKLLEVLTIADANQVIDALKRVTG
jgi:hypothetical protein